MYLMYVKCCINEVLCINVLLCYVISCSAGESHVPVSMEYLLSDIFADLLNFAVYHLVLGGRLVYWLPVYRPE